MVLSERSTEVITSFISNYQYKPTHSIYIVEKRKTGEHLAAKVVSNLPYKDTTNAPNGPRVNRFSFGVKNENS